MVECKRCGNDYTGLGQHWARSQCGYPEISEHQKEIIVGLLMGDGSIHEGSKYGFLQTSMINEEYLHYLDEELGNLSTGVKYYDEQTSSGNDIYNLNTRCHPYFTELRKWYDTGEKVWPKDIQLTPTTLKHLYVSDGNLDTYGSAERARISMCNEHDNKEKIETMFENVDIEIGNWVESKRESVDGYRCSAVFSKEQTHEFLDYIGEPVAGFEYKWLQ